MDIKRIIELNFNVQLCLNMLAYAFLFFLFLYAWIRKVRSKVIIIFFIMSIFGLITLSMRFAILLLGGMVSFQLKQIIWIISMSLDYASLLLFIVGCCILVFRDIKLKSE